MFLVLYYSYPLLPLIIYNQDMEYALIDDCFHYFHATKGLMGVERTRETNEIWIGNFILLIFRQNWRNNEILPNSSH